MAITKDESGDSIFWFNSSETRVATFTFSPLSLGNQFGNFYTPSLTPSLIRTSIGYICVTDTYYGRDCYYWGSVGWNSGDSNWGYYPESAKRKCANKRSLLTRMTLRPGPGSSQFTLSITDPSPIDSDLYVFGLYWHNIPNFLIRFKLQDMSTYKGSNPPVYPKPSSPRKFSSSVPGMLAISNPTFTDSLAVETGFSDSNVWLEWIHYSAAQHNKGNCFVCGAARPHLGSFPLHVPVAELDCFLSLFSNKSTNHSACESWKLNYPIVPSTSPPPPGITIYPGNYTCFSSPYSSSARPLGNFTMGYCSDYQNGTSPTLQAQTQALSDIFWICGDMKIRNLLPKNWYGECALSKAIIPLHIIPWTPLAPATATSPHHSITKRDVTPFGSLDPHVYIDAIGVPRGVPNEFKARDQFAAGFESLFLFVTVNKNVDWINYIYYNQQRFVNFTKDALRGIADQLNSTSHMTFQNRLALDMLLAEKGGVCKVLDKSSTCCTYIPDNTGPDGSVTIAIKKLEELSEELKRNSGVTDPWDQYFTWLTGWKKVLAEIGIVSLILFTLCALIFCCFIPCIRKLCLASELNPTFVLSTPSFYINTGDHDTDDDTDDGLDPDLVRALSHHSYYCPLTIPSSDPTHSHPLPRLV